MSKAKSEAQNPLILRCQRLMEAFAKSDDERDFLLDRLEGFLLYVDLDKPQSDLEQLEGVIKKDEHRFVLIPKMTFYETKKIMEGFVNEKVYDIDTKEKLLDIIQSKEARENFLEFIYDHHSELEKWHQFYQERSRIRIIEWLRQNHFHFVFEEDLDFPKSMIEKLKKQLFDSRAGKDVQAARKTLVIKAKTYYSNEALNPRPKRGRPPKQAAKLEVEPQVTTDIYTTVTPEMRPFLFTPDHASSSLATFSSKFETEEDLLAHRRAQHLMTTPDVGLESLNQKLASLRSLSSRWMEAEAKKTGQPLLQVEEEEFPVEVAETPRKLPKIKPPKPAAVKKTKIKAVSKQVPAKAKKLPPPVKKGKQPAKPPRPAFKKAIVAKKAPLKTGGKKPAIKKPQVARTKQVPSKFQKTPTRLKKK